MSSSQGGAGHPKDETVSTSTAARITDKKRARILASLRDQTLDVRIGIRTADDFLQIVTDTARLFDEAGVDPIPTHQTRISARKLATTPRFADEWVGTLVVHTTFDGERLVGKIDRFEGMRPIITFADGRWAFGSLSVEVIDLTIPA